MKEQYEYLIDKYDVKLIVNDEYSIKNNLHSIKLASEYISNTYIIPCDIWCKNNPYNHYENFSWYMVSDALDNESSVIVNSKNELKIIKKEKSVNSMLGICYLCEKPANVVRKKIAKLCKDKRYNNSFWEEVLYEKDQMIVFANLVSSSDVVEINTYEQLREFDKNSNHLKTDAIDVICQVLNAAPDDISDINMLKKGMTNRSFVFKCNNNKYIMRIPGEGTDQLIDRVNEALVYNVITGKNLCDDICYINPKNGYKITKFYENVRTCNPSDRNDVKKCMSVLKKIHNMKLKISHEFDIFSQIEFYESLWNEETSAYKTYEETKQNVFSLKSYICKHNNEKVLTHIDPVADNFYLLNKKMEKKTSYD